MHQPHHWVERTRPQPRRLDVRPYIFELSLRAGALHMVLWVTPNGAARPEEILHLVGLEHLLQAGVVITRTDLELHDEVVAGDGPALEPPAGHGRHNQPNHSPVTGLSAFQGRSSAPPAEVEPRARPTSLLPGPLTFDS